MIKISFFVKEVRLAGTRSHRARQERDGRTQSPKKRREKEDQRGGRGKKQFQGEKKLYRTKGHEQTEQ